jgi:hypothetical protein
MKATLAGLGYAVAAILLIITPGSDTVWRIADGKIAKYGKLSELKKAQSAR